MRTQIFHFSEENRRVLEYLITRSQGSGNDLERSKMKAIIEKALQSELTDAQRRCITEYYLGGKKQKEIASALGVNKSTVSRHIKTAVKKLKNIASYYM